MDQLTEEQRERAAADYLAVAEAWVTGRENENFPPEVLLEMFPDLAEINVQDEALPGPNGPVPVRLYDPSSAPWGTMLWIHGGGFAIGDLDMPEAHWVSLSLAAQGFRVVSVDYRKTLDGAQYPVASDDVRAAWRWVVERADSSASASAGIHLGGASAGGALAASLVVRLRDAGERIPDSLVLVYPVVHPRLPPLTAELEAATEGLPATAQLIEGMSAFMAGSVGTFHDPQAFAGLSDPTGFPPTLILNSERDFLRASGERFAIQLRDAGVSVECVTEADALHGHLSEPDNPAAVRSLHRIADWLTRRSGEPSRGVRRVLSYPNPLIPGFNPDPSVVRVGSEYFIATSTFEYLPGIPIYRSGDFVTWERIGHVATRTGQFAVEEVPTAGGAWAPTIRHRDGMFHLVITDAMGRGMLHFTAADAAGPWSDGDLILAADGSASVNGIDPDLAWDDDGTAFITYSGLILSGESIGSHLGIQQVRVDLDRHRALEEPRSLWSGGGLQFPEAPHLYHLNGRWYLMIAEGGTERGHGISIARGDSPMGPFTPAPTNPLLSARSTSRQIQNTGHGDLVIGPDGEWLVVLLGVRPRSMTRAFSALGRETFVTSLEWRDDGWPEIDPVELAPRPGSKTRDEFDSPEFASDWIAVRRLPQDVGSLTERPGRLVLHADGSTLDDPRPVFVGRRQEHLTATARALLDVTDGVGGLAVRYDERFHVGITAGAGMLRGHAHLGGLEQEWSRPFDGGQVELLIRSRRPVDDGGFPLTSDVLDLAAVIDGAELVLAEIDGRFLSSEVTESFTGRVVGPFATHGTVAVTWFAYEGHDE
jgi:xylan 1,4-beta-xylosidase